MRVDALGARLNGAHMNRNFDAIRVIIVDDDPVMREGFIQILRGDSSIEVAGEAANGNQALSLAI